MNLRSRYLILCVLLTAPVVVAAPKDGGFEINADIHDVQTFRVGKNLVRYIHYNRLEMPNFVFELIKTPKYALLQKMNLNYVTVTMAGKSKKLDFHNPTMVELEKIRVDKNAIVFEVAYIAAEHTAPHIYSTCRMEIKNDAFSNPICQVLKWGGQDVTQPSPPSP